MVLAVIEMLITVNGSNERMSNEINQISGENSFVSRSDVTLVIEINENITRFL